MMMFLPLSTAQLGERFSPFSNLNKYAGDKGSLDCVDDYRMM